MTGIVGILLAAGRARRFGAPKLLHPLPGGVPVGERAARGLIEAVPDALAVVPAGDRILRALFEALGLNVVEHPDPPGGMGSSIAAGVRATAGAGGWMVALGDMPWVGAATLRAVRDRLEGGASIVAPFYRGRRGHPVGFTARWGPELTRLTGDEGARRLIDAHPDALTRVHTGDAGAVRDVDYPWNCDPGSPIV